LEQLGKQVRIVNADPVPDYFEFLPGQPGVEVSQSLDGDYDSLIVLECNNLERTGVANLQGRHVINIDHHSASSNFGNLNWIDATAAAVAEMVYDLIVALGVEITPEIATNLYVAIVTDTGSFHFSGTSARTFRISSELVVCGADPASVSRQVFMSYPASRLRLLASVLNTLQIHPSGQLAWIALSQSMMEEAGADPTQTEGMVNFPLSIGGVELVAFFREDEAGGIRVSLRRSQERRVGKEC
jgi:phosphoesterase RecJ-like protein